MDHSSSLENLKAYLENFGEDKSYENGQQEQIKFKFRNAQILYDKIFSDKFYFLFFKFLT